MLPNVPPKKENKHLYVLVYGIEYLWKTTEKLVTLTDPWEGTGQLGIGLERKFFTFKAFTFSCAYIICFKNTNTYKQNKQKQMPLHQEALISLFEVVLE